MRRRIEKALRRAAALALVVFLAVPELAFAIEPPAKRPKSLDAMSPHELDAFVADLNQSANWRKYRRPNDPPDFVPGKPVRVMHGAGASLGRGGRGGGARSFRQSGLAGRKGGGSIGSSRRRGSNDQSAMETGRGSSRSSRSSSSSSRSSFGSSGRSSFGSGSGFGNSNGMNNFE